MSKENLIILDAEFTPPNLDAVKKTEELIFLIGTAINPELSPESCTLDVPENFLKFPLTNYQAQAVDSELTLPYAERTLKIQAEVASVPIVENFEKFIYLPELFKNTGVDVSFSNLPFHEACGKWAGKPRDFWVRASVGKKLVTLANALNSAGLVMKVEDAFRPQGVQEGLFKRRIEWTKNSHPEWSFKQIVAEARSKTAVTPRLASHKGGAAIDMTIQTKDGIALDLGNKYPQGGALVVLDCPYVTQEQWSTRQIFSRTATLAGFTVYPGEDWHISYGDNLASLSKPLEERNLYSSSYGPVKNFDRITGEIIDTYDKDELDIIFNP